MWPEWAHFQLVLIIVKIDIKYLKSTKDIKVAYDISQVLIMGLVKRLNKD